MLVRFVKVDEAQRSYPEGLTFTNLTNMLLPTTLTL